MTTRPVRAAACRKQGEAVGGPYGGDEDRGVLGDDGVAEVGGDHVQRPSGGADGLHLLVLNPCGVEDPVEDLQEQDQDEGHDRGGGE